MTKAALDNMVKSLSLELKDDLIKVIGLTIEAGIFSY
jgi:short-subunit dehydrogenase